MAEGENIFDNDNGLDCILDDEIGIRNTRKSGSSNSGCLGLIVLLMLPIMALSQFILFR